MRGVRKHVDHTRRSAAVTRISNQYPCITRQRRWVAAHIHNPPGWLPVAESQALLLTGVVTGHASELLLVQRSQ